LAAYSCFQSRGCTLMRPRRYARCRLWPDVANLRGHPPCSGAFRAHPRGRLFVKPALGRHPRRHPSHSTGSKHEDGLLSLRWTKALRIPIWATIVAIVVSGLTGYLALSRFLARQLIVTGSILVLVYLLLLWVEGFAQGLGDDGATTGHWLKERAGLDQRRHEQVALPISLFLKFAVLVLSVPSSWRSGDIRGLTSTTGTGSCFSASISQIRKYLSLPF
jgi:small-conductance mechanosensitive channel